MTPSVVRAAGCVLWRHAATGEGVEIVLVHRPKYDDWTHPKGKLEPAEAADPVGGALRAAVREVREETGLECVPGEPLGTLRYPDEGRLKEVRYWAARATDGVFVPNDEVDRVAWLAPEAARALLTHERDRPLVDGLLATLPGVTPDAGPAPPSRP